MRCTFFFRVRVGVLLPTHFRLSVPPKKEKKIQLSPSPLSAFTTTITRHRHFSTFFWGFLFFSSSFLVVKAWCGGRGPLESWIVKKHNSGFLGGVQMRARYYFSHFRQTLGYWLLVVSAFLMWYRIIFVLWYCLIEHKHLMSKHFHLLRLDLGSSEKGADRAGAA